MTRISVVMPVYNCAEYVDAAVDSILGQTFSDFEFIIVDDGSTDETGQRVAAAAARDPRIRVITRDNRGLIASLNEGMALAKGDLVARMDGDDISTPDRFAKQVAFLDAHPDCGLVGGQLLYIDPKGRPLASMAVPLDDDAIVSDMLNDQATLGHPTVMFCRALGLDFGGYQERFSCAEDIDFFLRMSDRAQLANLADVVLRYRLHPKSISHTNARRQTESARKAVVEAAARKGIPASAAPVDDGETETLVDYYRRWAWWALNSNEIATARLYATKVLLRRPANSESWRLMVCALRGHQGLKVARRRPPPKGQRPY